MKSILKLSLVSLCASGAVFTTQLAQANHDRSASKDSDKQLVITEPAGAEASASLSTSGEISGMTVRTSNLIGEKVIDSSGKRCGTVRDALIDLNSGRLAFLVINAHGREIAVPGDAFRSQGNEVVLNIDRDRLNSAPQFSYSNINDPNWASQTYSFYGQSWQGGQVSSSSPSWQSSSTAYQSSPGYQSSSSYQSGTSYQSGSSQQFSEAAGAAPGLVTGRDQDCYADCILHKYQAGKGSARATDEAYWNNVPGDRLYTQYPASSGAYQNYAYNSSSYSSQPSFSSSEQSGVWYGSGGRTYGSSGTAMSSSGSFSSSSGVISESAGASSGMHLYRSSELVGMHIRANNGQDLGTVRDVVLDLNSGRVIYAVVAPTSSDFGGKFLAIPPAAFVRGGADQHVLSLNMSTDQLRTAPSFEPNNWPQPQNQTFINETYNFYHVQPSWQGHGEGNWQKDDRHMRHHEGTGTDTYHGSQDLNNNSQGSSSSGTYQGSSTSGTYQGSSTDQQNLNNQDQDQNHKPVSEPSGSEVKGAEHHDSTLNLQGSQDAAGATSSSSSVDQSSSSSSLQSSDDQLKKGAERQTDAIREPSGADQSSATQSGTSGAQSSTELKSSQTQSGTATSEAAGAATEKTENEQPTSTATTPSSPSASSSTTSPSSSTDTSTQPSTSSTSSNPDQSSTSTSTAASTQSGTSSSTDQGISEKVRTTLKSDSTLSPISSNVQVADQNGKIALTGTVKSEAEKQQIVSKAEEIAGSGNVIDNLQVKSDSNQ